MFGCCLIKELDGCDFFFFFQAEDGIRDVAVTGVQTCALPICAARLADSGADRAAALWARPGTGQSLDRRGIPGALLPVLRVRHLTGQFRLFLFAFTSAAARP